jgi:hypothetical protein
MKQILPIVMALLGFVKSTWAQPMVSSFDSIALTGNYWNGMGSSAQWFADGMLSFQNQYDTAFGGYWAKGFAVSKVSDSLTPGYGNLYASRAGSGYTSLQYAVGQDRAVVRTNSPSIAPVALYITNTTYAARSMEFGDAFAKKFGGPSGNDPDWFLLTIERWYAGQLSDTVAFYLADYRFADNSQDYIVNNWRLLSIGIVPCDSLVFKLSSSDVGTFGMNTPAFFCIDQVAHDFIEGISTEQPSAWWGYPNPSAGITHFRLPNPLGAGAEVQVYAADGRCMGSWPAGNSGMATLDFSLFAPGIYTVRLSSNSGLMHTKIVRP